MHADNEKVKGLPQIEFGTKIISTINQPTFIFAFLWPLRLYATKASGYSNLVPSPPLCDDYYTIAHKVRK
jgi:hypothetical protein